LKFEIRGSESGYFENISAENNLCPLPQTGKKCMNNEKTKFVRQVAKVDLV
jgi:hypothetical protein